jgi:alpha-glucosidase
MQCITYFLLLLSVVSVYGIDLDWWEGGNFYQIYPRSFKDSNSDGIGDLNGIASKIGYLKELGMDGVWLSPIMTSPQADFGYDISDYRNISKEFGTLEDLDALVAECEKQQVKLILDFVPSYTSDEHEWFKKSENREPGYENYYIWHPGTFDAVSGERVPPTNVPSVFRFPAWSWSEKRKQFYYHAFLNKQPALNYRCQAVVKEMKDVLTYWLSRGIQGFRVDSVKFMFIAQPDAQGNYPNEPLTGESCSNPDDYCYTQHIYVTDQPESYDMLFQWRELIDNFAKSHDKVTKIIMSEVYSSLENMIRYYGEGGREGAHIPFNFEMISYVDITSTAADYKLRIDNWLNRVPKGKQANWVVSTNKTRKTTIHCRRSIV